MALLSTWQEVCGIAHYSAFLKRALDPHIDVTVIPTPRDIIMNAQTKDEVKAADDFIDEIADKASDFDVVSMQFEPGLYGRDHGQSLARAARIIEKSKDFVISFHHFHREPRMVRAHIIRPRHFWLTIGNILTEWRASRVEKTWNGFYAALVEHSKKHRVTAIAHTKRDARYLRFKLPGVEVLDNPLCYMEDAYIAAIGDLAKSSDLSRTLLSPKAETRYIGVFGFYSEYKGFDTAIMALKHLPPNYELLMFSGVHDSTLIPNQHISPYLNHLMAVVKKEKLLQRVRFIGSVSDDDMLVGMMACDAVVVPYINSSHTASGPASQAVELNRMTYCSRNRQFTEFAKYFPDNFEFFDIGNYIELAQKILHNAPLARDRMVHGIRFVDFPKRSRPVTIDDTVKNYLKASGVSAVYEIRSEAAE